MLHHYRLNEFMENIQKKYNEIKDKRLNLVKILIRKKKEIRFYEIYKKNE